VGLGLVEGEAVVLGRAREERSQDLLAARPDGHHALVAVVGRLVVSRPVEPHLAPPVDVHGAEDADLARPHAREHLEFDHRAAGP